MATDNGSDPVKRNRSIPAKCTDAERSVIMRAVEWRLAQSGIVTGTTHELTATAIAEICREWIADNALAALKPKAE